MSLSGGENGRDAVCAAYSQAGCLWVGQCDSEVEWSVWFVYQSRPGVFQEVGLAT